MLRKSHSDWSHKQIVAIREIKQKMQNLPLLQIPSDKKRNLQTDASDKHWGSVFLEEGKDQKRKFKDSLNLTTTQHSKSF